MVRYLFAYYIHGFNISSVYPLTGVVKITFNTPPDINIKHGNFDTPPLALADSGVLYCIDNDSIYLKWESIGSFHIFRGQEITVMPDPSVAIEIIQRFIKTAVLAVAMYQRGLAVLHANAIVIDGKAIILCGDSGCGKSTLCAGLHSHGHHLLADDIVVCHQNGAGFQVYPGVQEFKLWPDSLVLLGVDHENLPRVSTTMQKRVFTVEKGIYREPAVLSAIYILELGEEDAVYPVAPLTATMELIKNSYGIRLLQGLNAKEHFKRTMSIAQAIPLRKLKRKCELDNRTFSPGFVERRKHPRPVISTKNTHIYELIENDSV